MVKKFKFIKMVASGNDFIVIDQPLPLSGRAMVDFVKLICQPKYGIGADGVLLLDKTKGADIRMRIINADGSFAAMCGNGARCVALYFASQAQFGAKNKLSIHTQAGIIRAQVENDLVRINLTDPLGIRLNVSIKPYGRPIRVSFIDTGVPHVVVFVEGLSNLDVAGLGRIIRNHKAFAPEGTNVNFVEIIDAMNIRLRTYERGVEDETLSCGTGSVAAAIISSLMMPNIECGNKKINVHTQGGEVLKVYFNNAGKKVSDVWLEGKVRIVFNGEWVGVGNLNFGH